MNIKTTMLLCYFLYDTKIRLGFSLFPQLVVKLFFKKFFI